MSEILHSYGKEKDEKKKKESFSQNFFVDKENIVGSNLWDEKVEKVGL